MITKVNTLLVGLLVLFSSLSANEKADFVDWHQAQWIGYTIDSRPEQWSQRTLRRYQPPMDINEWAPTADDVKEYRRKVHVSPLLRRSFHIDKAVAKAEIMVSGLGLYELYVNGQKVGNRVLDPIQTSYNKRVFYSTFDVSTLLKDKKNTLGLMLGNGFYGQNMAFAAGLQYGKPCAIVQLKLSYKDGSEAFIVSDEQWKAHQGPILFDNIYLGESYDARKEIVGWSTANFDASDWDTVQVMKAPGGVMLEQNVEPMRIVREVKPIGIWPANEGWILDMGENMTGWLRLSLNEKAGTTVEMRFSEHLMPGKMDIDPASTGIHVTGGVQTDFYICKGEENEQWEPRFTYHGFRYVQIKGLLNPNIEQFVGCFVRSDVARIGQFECSDDMINTFYEVSIRTIEDNIQGILTDCPHRERCAWMGDAYVVAEATSYNFDMERFWRKTSADMNTVLGVSPAHFKDTFPFDLRAPGNISVGKRLCLQARPDWGAATVMLPWYSYLYYGDISVLKQAWKMMDDWMDYLHEKAQVNGVINGGYGDWCPPGGNPNMDTPPALTSTALYYQSLLAMEKMAKALKKRQDAAQYAEKAEAVKQGFNKRFFDEDKKSYGSQTGNAFALFSQLVPRGNEQAVADDLAQRIMQDAKGHYTTGIFGARALYTVLNDYGHADVSRHLWKITDYPSLGYMTEVFGLTTWPENVAEWDATKRFWRNSFNHPMQSGFAATFHESVGGIRPNADYPGFKKFTLKPTFIPDLEWANITHQSPFGMISSRWKRVDGHVSWLVEIPNGTTASIDLSANQQSSITVNGKIKRTSHFTLNGGKYTIIVR